MKRRRLRKIQARIYDTPLCILPTKLGEITSLIENEVLGLGSQNAIYEDADHPLLSEIIPLAFHGPQSGSARTETAPSKIAVLNLYGTIAQRMNVMMRYSGGTSTQVFGAAFDEVVADPDISTIIIRVNSPGGEVPGVEELANKIYAARGEKRIIAHVDPTMASAATWIATAAEEVIAAPSALQIGSIGVFMVHYEHTKRDAKEGDNYTVIRSVPGKGEGMPIEKMSEDFQKHLQHRADSIHQKFASAVARNRGVSVEKVEQDFGAGRTLMADDALRAGLIDRIATFEELLSELGARSTPEEPTNGDGSPIEINSAVGQVASAILTPGVENNAKTPERSLIMDPKIRLALVQAGLIKATADEAEAQAACDLFFAAKGTAIPTETAKVVEAISGQTLLVSTVETLNPVTQVGQVGNVQTPNTGLSISDLTAMVATAGASLPAEDRISLTNELITAHEAGSLTTRQALDTINTHTTALNPPAGASVPAQVTEDARDKFMAAARDEVLVRSMRGERPEQIYDRVEQTYIDWKPNTRQQGLGTPLAIARQCLVQAGVEASRVMNLTAFDIARVTAGADPRSHGLGGFLASDGAYNVSGMFQNVFLDSGNVVLRRGYDHGRSTFKQWMQQGEDIPDFNTVNRVLLGEVGDPKAIAEDGEFEETTLSDGKEDYKLTVWGHMFSLTWQMIMNDKLGAFMQLPTKMGSSFIRKENRLAYGQLKDNANLSDGGALFNANAITVVGGHNNVTTGVLATAADYVAAFGVMQAKMRKQKGLDEESATLNIDAQHVIYPSNLDDIILTALNSQSVVINSKGNSGTQNPWEGRLEPIVESELDAAAGGSDTGLYLSAGEMNIETIEYAYLAGLPAPVLEMEDSFNRLGRRQRMYMAFGTKAIEFKGLQQHTGAV